MRANQRTRAVTAITIVAVVTLPRLAAAQQPDDLVDAEQVLSAIARGIDYLKREQTPRGRWNEMPGYDGGVTALCALSLLNAGVERTDPVISRALEYLRSIEPQKTYTVALQTMVFAAANPKRDLLLIQRNVQWLEANQIADGDRSGSWSYPGAAGDNSNSQFALLALYDAQSVGAKVSRQTWERSLEYWERSQNGDGSWGYTPGDAGYGSMTCAGIGAYAICSAALKEGDAAVEGGRIDCCRPHEKDDVLERAIAWMARNFSVRHNPRPVQGGQPALYYYLYGLERAGRLTARRFIGQHDWYREGAELLVHEQDPLSHFWQGTWHAERMPHIGTSFALLFLSKGRRPVIMAKLKYGASDEWNRHRHDAAHLAAYTERAWDMGLTWQVMDPEPSTVEDLLQAPVLYISGSKLPALKDQAKKLREYIDRGGFIFAEASCGDSEEFDRGFRELMQDVFPEPEYQLRPVEPNHPIWRMEEIIRPDSPYVGKLWAVEYGCRSCVVYSAEDLSCYWELANPARQATFPAPVSKRVADALAVGVNVLTYATNREPKGKEQSFISPLASLDGESLGNRGSIEIAKLRHGGGCNDAPGAVMNLLRAAVQGEVRLQAGLEAPLIDVSDEELFRYHLVFMHGRYNFEFSAAEREQLRKYLERGGTLLADSICASKEFTTAFRREMGKIFPQAKLEAIPADDPIWTDAFGGFDVRRVTLRDPQQTGANETVAARFRELSPQFEGIKLDGRWAVVFSPYDLSCALEQHEALTCRGYSREDAARIGLNVLLYSINQ